MTKPKYSYSKISTFRQCPFKYKLQYIDKVPVPQKSKYLSFGLTVADVIEEIYKNALKYTSLDKLTLISIIMDYWVPKQYKKEFVESLQESYSFLGYASEKEEQTYINNLIAYMTLFIEKNPIQPMFGIEVPIHLELPEYDITGRIDWLEFKRETSSIDIIDNKSGKNLIPNLASDIQLCLYKTAVEQMYPSLHIGNVGFYYLALDKKVIVDSSILETNKVFDIIYNVHQRIIMGDFPKFKSNLCKYCEVCHECK